MNLTMSTERTDHNPAMDDSASMDHWECTLRYGTRRMSLIFSMGSGHHGKTPTLADVMECLVLDAGGIDSANTFEDWASDYGMDTDSRKAERSYRACVAQVAKLHKLLGADYESVLKRFADA